jgi:hypothetical protein
VGPSCSSSPTPDHNPGIWPPEHDHPQNIADDLLAFQSRRGPSHNSRIGPDEHPPV